MDEIERILGFDHRESHGFVSDDSLLLDKTWADGKWIYHIWNTRTKQVMKPLENAKDPVLSPDGRTLAAIMPDGLIFMDLSNFQMRRFRTGTGLNWTIFPRMVLLWQSSMWMATWNSGM